MLRPLRIVGMILSMIMTAVLASTAMAADAAYQPGEIIVKFSPTMEKVLLEKRAGQVFVDIASLDQKLRRYDAREISQIFPHKNSELSLIYQIDFDPQYDAKAVARDFAQDKNLFYAEPRYLHRACGEPNDPNFQNGLQWFFGTVHAPEAWDVTHGDHSVIIGIVDTGVDWDHPDLADNRWFNSGEDIWPEGGNGRVDAPDVNGIDDDGNGFVDDFFGWDFVGLGTPDNLPDEGAPLHGTHTAGVCAAATDNELTNAGMSWNCTYMPVKVSRDGNSNITHGYEGIQYAMDNGAAVINLSWTRGDTASAFEQEIIDSAFAKGVILVAAAGNDEPGNAFSPPDPCPLSYPAVYDHVTAVAATDMIDKATDFTYYGPWVDVAAPGKAIYSSQWDNSYVMQAGNTSSSCALVSGVAALLKVIEPDMNSDQFEVRMQTTSNDIDDLNPSYAGLLGGGRLNAYKALINDTVSVVNVWNTGSAVPQGYALSQNRPNPFNPSTTISYSLPLDEKVTLKVYNVRGELVKILVNEMQPAGEYAVQWDGRDGLGQRVASGIYFCCLETNHWSQARKMVLLK